MPGPDRRFRCIFSPTGNSRFEPTVAPPGGNATTPHAEVETGLFSWTDPEETTDMRFYRVIHP